jgi:UrcA family protein
MTKLATKMLLLGGLAGLAAAGAAGASPANGEVPTQIVSYSADMLGTDSGARAVYHRIAKAAERVCPNTSYSLLVHSSIQKCREDAISAAVNKIHSQRLAAVHAAASSKSSG